MLGNIQVATSAACTQLQPSRCGDAQHPGVDGDVELTVARTDLLTPEQRSFIAYEGSDDPHRVRGS